MKKMILVVSAFLLTFSLFAQEPLVKFYLNDGSTKQYNLSEIDSLGVIDKKNNYVMRIHYDDTLIAYYPTEIIGSIKFEKDDIQRDILNVYIFSYPKPYKLSSIDSLIFYIDQYQPLTIGSQVWMLKNLNVDHYRNGDSIPEVRDDKTWINLKTGAFCYYDNDSANNPIIGKLYNWYSLNDSNRLAPEGWHLPTDSEWKTLEIHLGLTKEEADTCFCRGENVAEKMKMVGKIFWNDLKSNHRNISGFSALPGGRRGQFGFCRGIGYQGLWWTYPKDHTINWTRILYDDETCINRDGSIPNEWGMSVRCIKNK